MYFVDRRSIFVLHVIGRVKGQRVDNRFKTTFVVINSYRTSYTADPTKEGQETLDGFRPSLVARDGVLDRIPCWRHRRSGSPVCRPRSTPCRVLFVEQSPDNS